MGREADVFPGDLLPRSRPGRGQGEAGAANVEPFKTVMSGNREVIARLSMEDLEKILMVTLTGMSVEEFRAEAAKWLDGARIRAGSVPTPSLPTSRCRRC